MSSPDLLEVSVAGIVVAFLLLALLAVMMRVIIALFPERKSSADAAVVAAMTAAYRTLYPGAAITNIEERK